MRNKMSALTVSVLGVAMSSSAFAVVDYSAITGAVDVSTVAAAIVALGVVLMGPQVAAWATRKLVGFFR